MSNTIITKKRIRKPSAGRLKFLALSIERQKKIITNNAKSRIASDFRIDKRFISEREAALEVKCKPYKRAGRRKILK
jgi:hypothetical protein